LCAKVSIEGELQEEKLTTLKGSSVGRAASWQGSFFGNSIVMKEGLPLLREPLFSGDVSCQKRITISETRINSTNTEEPGAGKGNILTGGRKKMIPARKNVLQYTSREGGSSRESTSNWTFAWDREVREEGKNLLNERERGPTWTGALLYAGRVRMSPPELKDEQSLSAKKGKRSPLERKMDARWGELMGFGKGGPTLRKHSLGKRRHTPHGRGTHQCLSNCTSTE